MQISIGKLSIGVRANWKYNWKRYIIPKETQGKTHPYFKFGMWWLMFFLYYPKKCSYCFQWMPKGGYNIFDDDTDEHLGTFCKTCYDEINDVKNNFNLNLDGRV